MSDFPVACALWDIYKIWNDKSFFFIWFYGVQVSVFVESHFQGFFVSVNHISVRWCFFPPD